MDRREADVSSFPTVWSARGAVQCVGGKSILNSFATGGTGSAGIVVAHIKTKFCGDKGIYM
eukprot:1143092-Pelagomonas_calceolata.AAC.3